MTVVLYDVGGISFKPTVYAMSLLGHLHIVIRVIL
jgi:hypothetical protein